MDWHEVSIGLITVVGALGAWVWMRTVNQLDRLEQRMTKHIDEDRIEFGKVYERISLEVRSLDERVDRRFIAGRK